jgi:transposase
MDRMITLSQKKLNQGNILHRLISDSNYTISEAAEVLGLSERHVKRLKGAFKKCGYEALVHKNIGRSPAHAVSEEVIQKILKLKKSKLFENSNFKHFQEILGREKFGIKISYSSLHNILTSDGIKSPKTRRQGKKHRRRKRKAKEGIMLQIDASPHEWFADGQKYSLHGAIDDATGKITALYMCKNECLQGYFEVMRTVIHQNGIPASIYADRHAIFLSPKDGKLTIDEQLEGVQINDTQFGRALKQLGITLIKARSAQAKGRIERLWETLQSRLPVEFALENITTVDAANSFLEKYINEYNDTFAVASEDSEIVYRPVSPGTNIENILCVIEKRTFDNGGVFSFHNRSFKIVSDKPDRILPHKGRIDVLVSPIFGIRACFAGIIYNVISFIKPQKTIEEITPKTKRQKYIPDDSHYYKYGHKLLKKVTFEDDDYAILKMLERIFLQDISPLSKVS